MSVASMLNRTCDIERATYSTSAGTTSVSYAAHLSAVKCRAHQLSESELVRFGAERGQRVWRFSVEPGNDIVRTDRIKYTDLASVQHVIDVTSVHNSGEAGIIKVVTGDEVTGAS